MKWVEALLAVEHYARLSLSIEGANPSESDIRARLRDGGINVIDVSLTTTDRQREYSMNVREARRPSDVAVPRVVEQLGREPGVRSVQWRRLGNPT